MTAGRCRRALMELSPTSNGGRVTALGHDQDRTPDWQVQSVFDPDGGGFDFACTIGLHDRGARRATHLWGRPPIGDDPGEDWMFSDHDRCRILNEIAWRLIDGEVEIGSCWTEEYDAGLVTVRFQIDPPGDRSSRRSGSHQTPGWSRCAGHCTAVPSRARAPSPSGHSSVRRPSTPPSSTASVAVDVGRPVGRCRRASSPVVSSVRSRPWWPAGWRSSGRPMRSRSATLCGRPPRCTWAAS